MSRKLNSDAYYQMVSINDNSFYGKLFYECMALTLSLNASWSDILKI